MSFKMALTGVPHALLTGAAADNTESPTLGIPASFTRHNFYIRSGAGVSAGAVQIYTAMDPAYAGSWAPFGEPIDVPAASTERIVQLPTPLLLRAIKVMITTEVANGTINVNYLGA